MPAVIEEMETTPNSQAAMDANAADKKRNKLGYHRTSVACVHCRRRKIRCLVAADDAQGRCENCIRLRKECQFFPVDQQPPVEKKSRPNSRLEAGSADPSATTPLSSSPTNMNPDSVEPFYPYAQVPIGASSGDMAAFNPGAFAATQIPGFTPDRPMGPGEFSSLTTMEGGLAWDEFTTIPDPQMMATMNAGKGQMMNLAPHAWNPAAVPAAMSPNSPMSGASPMAGQAQPMHPGPAYAMQPDGSVWPVPPQPSRTMSYPGQDMSSSFPSHFQPQMTPDLKRRMTTPAHPTGSHSAPGPSPDMQAPPAVPYQAQAGMGFTQWPQMNAIPGMGLVPYPMYAGDVPQQFAHPPMGHPGQPGRSGP
ncbi:uncharacterized protein N7482_004887 [Penicillium canariense]|uniref:Zn(2)-C6 fungal-type domain-containing protein n=1 Tax=Penicillium canariense TaxID=189055 RepID=A0A9W9LMH3_9EURO|nr:uncharacterized protein N7482_004887 [Penicillium canariense]KAJ5166106.1 hypothetical protein N7482_004887 [Penicillium canariense]